MILEELLMLKQKMAAPKIVCLCGSIRRAAQAFDDYALSETIEGNIVLTVGTTKYHDAQLFNSNELEEAKIRLDLSHLWKIELANEVIILNKDGYIGESTQRELEYAKLLGKPIRWLEKPTVSRNF